MLEKLFKLSENHTDVKTEILAGITTFMTMAYILAVNPSILSATGMDQGALFTATALISFIGTLLMAFLANYPFALAPGMGLNAYFAYTVVLGMGYSWEFALTAVFAEGIIFILLSLTNVREAIFNAIPKNLKSAVSVGIGLFIAFVGLQNAKIVIGGSTLVQLFSVEKYNELNGVNASFNDVGITVALALIGILVTGILVIKNVKGNILWGILITWILGIICQFAGIYVPNPELGFYNLLPDFSNGLSIPSLSPILFKLDFHGIVSADFVVILFAFLFVDLFDTIGTLVGVSSKAGMLDENGNFPNIEKPFLVDAVGTCVGSMTGCTTISTFIESTTGVEAGGRTGLTAIVTGILFFICVLFAPLFLMIPNAATGAALIFVGFSMLSGFTKLDFSNFKDCFGPFVMILFGTFTGDIASAICLGILADVIIKVITGDFKKVNPVLYILCIPLILYFIL